MIPMSLAQIAHVVGGELVPADAGEVVVDGPVVTDSRVASQGSLYVARVGENADGHQYAGSAASNGAVATLGSRAVDATPTVVVEDVQEAFAALARAVVDAVEGLAIVGITGSSGKTSTKDLLGQVLDAQGETIWPEGSFNSEVGVPLTVTRVTPTTKYLVAEMGANGVGHIEYLTRIAPPRIGIVLNVGRAHVGEFGSVDAIARTKAELVRALPADGLAILNVDDPRVREMAEFTDARVLLVGRDAAADLRAVDVEVDPAGRARFTIEGDGDRKQVQLKLVGEHHVGNALAVYAAARELGVSAQDVVDVLGQAGPVSRWRMEVSRLANGVTLVNDAYNANPDSMLAAMRALGGMQAKGRRVAVLGRMLELGDASAEEHAAVGRAAAEAGVDLLVTIGADVEPLADGAAQVRPDLPVHHCADTDEAFGYLTGELVDGDVALLKSSRDSGLRYLGDRMVEENGVGDA